MQLGGGDGRAASAAETARVQHLHEAQPGLYLDPPVDVPLLAEVMVAMTVLGFRLDAVDRPGALA